MVIIHFYFQYTQMMMTSGGLTNLSWVNVLPTSLFSTLFNLLKSTGTVFNLSTSILSTFVFKLSKSDFTANLDVSTPVYLTPIF